MPERLHHIIFLLLHKKPDNKPHKKQDVMFINVRKMQTVSLRALVLNIIKEIKKISMIVVITLMKIDFVKEKRFFKFILNL